MNLPRILCRNCLSMQLPHNYRNLNLTHRSLINYLNSKLSSNQNYAALYPTIRCVHKAVTTNVPQNLDDKESFLTRLLKKMPSFNLQRGRLNVIGFLLYESIVDKINYADFFEEYNLPDTFYSWFAVTELHVWMLAARAMAEGDDGRIVRNGMVQALWSDVAHRVKKIGVVNTTMAKIQITELSEQFQAALLAYDEGLQTNDMVLAGALWRRLYQQKEVDAEHLDLLVKYIRKQVCVLDNMPKEELFSDKQTMWSSKK